MQLKALKIEGSFLYTSKNFVDERGTFEENWELENFKNQGLIFQPVSACHSYNTKKGILRGLHYQKIEHGQKKSVSCTSGSIYDVIVDLRTDSPTYLKWQSVELKERSGETLYIPAGCAHGFVTLEENSTVSYLIEGNYEPSAQGVVRWNDPLFGIQWPVSEPILSNKDNSAPDFIA